MKQEKKQKKQKRVLDEARLKNVLAMVEHEIRSVAEKHEPFNSAHEAWAILYEEVDELWDEIKKKKRLRDEKLMRMEAVQISATAARFIYDLL